MGEEATVRLLDKQAAVSLSKKHAVSLLSTPQISREGSHSKAGKQAALSLISKPQISGAGSRSKADKQAAVSLTKKRAVSLISKPQI